MLSLRLFSPCLQPFYLFTRKCRKLLYRTYLVTMPDFWSFRTVIFWFGETLSAFLCKLFGIIPCLLTCFVFSFQYSRRESNLKTRLHRAPILWAFFRRSCDFSPFPFIAWPPTFYVSLHCIGWKGIERLTMWCIFPYFTALPNSWYLLACLPNSWRLTCYAVTSDGWTVSCSRLHFQAVSWKEQRHFSLWHFAPSSAFSLLRPWRVIGAFPSSNAIITRVTRIVNNQFIHLFDHFMYNMVKNVLNGKYYT